MAGIDAQIKQDAKAPRKPKPEAAEMFELEADDPTAVYLEALDKKHEKEMRIAR
eukprot:CAMPEP_0204442620 /NCGR_PEP_ID=MMETSP0470-20130426/87491_1 /ASSEMBLY_ACC=CAM_ASM_000385 /TAXON_ID=2969 /ORGANISM="Oxyrrhis marina" /LENGTH=53 /DNA_ID=CAMNT_0051441843 /DNA_START=24 /DNA_END=181 /DNA_ORIENTATION=+